MSVKLLTLVWKHFTGSPTLLLTALALVDHARDDGSSVRPGVAHLARKTRQSERTVRRHLSELRRSGWLQTVCYPHGGRHRTTEYQINAQWIVASASAAPLGEPVIETRPPETTKHDTAGNKRVSHMSPQPPRTIIEPTTAITAAGEVAETGGPPQIPTSVFPAHKHASVLKILQGCPMRSRQDILDEVAGLAGRGRVRHALALLQALADKAVKGEFVPDAALDHRSMLERQNRIAFSIAQAKERVTWDITPSVAVRAHLAAMKEMLVRPIPCHPRDNR